MDETAPHDPEALARVRKLAHVLDNSIPLPGGFRIGWDAVLGLIPGVGDSVGAVVSAYIVMRAYQFGAPKEVLARMVGNVALEALVGAVPFIGDLFDAAWKANARNVALLERHLASPTRARRGSAVWLVITLLILFLLFAFALTLAFLLARGLVRLIEG